MNLENVEFYNAGAVEKIKGLGDAMSHGIAGNDQKWSE